MEKQIVSNVPTLLKEFGWGAQELKDRGIPHQTAYRIARGEIVGFSTVAKLCEVFATDDLNYLFSLE